MLTLDRGRNFLVVRVSKHWRRVPGEIAVLGGTGKLSGHDPRQPALGGCVEQCGEWDLEVPYRLSPPVIIQTL